MTPDLNQLSQNQQSNTDRKSEADNFGGTVRRLFQKDNQ